MLNCCNCCKPLSPPSQATSLVGHRSFEQIHLHTRHKLVVVDRDFGVTSSWFGVYAGRQQFLGKHTDEVYTQMMGEQSVGVK